MSDQVTNDFQMIQDSKQTQWESNRCLELNKGFLSENILRVN